MGKASRRKKEKKVQDQPQKKQKPARKKRARVSLEALEKKAAAVETAFSSVLKKAQQVVDEKEEGRASYSLKDYWEGLKVGANSSIENFKKGIDPDKLARLKKELRFILGKGGLYVVGIVSVVAIVMVVELHSTGRIFPWTKAGSIDLGYLPRDVAKEKLLTEVRSYMQQPMIFDFEDDSFEVTPEELGIYMNVDQTLARLPSFRFEQQSPPHLVATALTQRNITPHYTFDGDKVIRTLEQRIQVADKRAKSARFVYGEGGMNIEPEAAGIKINREKLIASVQKNLNSFETATVHIEMEPEQPQITAQDLENEREHLMRVLNNPITLTAVDESITIKLADYLDAISFRRKNSLKLEGQQPLPLILTGGVPELARAESVEIASNVQIQIDGGKIMGHLHENLIKNIERPTSPAKLFTNENSEVVIEGKGEDGRFVPQDRLIEAITLAANNGITSVPAPVLIDKAPLEISEDLKEKGIRELIATGHSAYYGSPPNRMFNIEFGTNKYNGLLIAPGEEFSFNEHLGEVDARSGFLPEKVIKQDKLEIEYGGGICQVSTTMYRAALLAGLPITERRAHSWKVSYYGQSMGHGLDATIYPGVTDLKFLNDTPGYILVQAYTEGAEAYFKIYGTSDGRSVVMDGPYGGGLTYRWNRILKKGGQEQIEEIWSRYKPIPTQAPPPPKPASPESN